MRPEQPTAWAALARSTASTVESAEMAATTGALPSRAAMTVLRISIFSSKRSVGASPSEPRQTMPVQPFSMSHWAWRATKARSTLQSGSKAVVMAGITPMKFIASPKVFRWGLRPV